MSKKVFDFRFGLIVIACALLLITPTLIFADPVPDPPVEDGYDDPIQVFCFLMTDIQAGAIPNSFQFQFQSLNWADEDVYGVAIMMNVGSSDVVGERPTLVGGNIDVNGQPFGPVGTSDHLAAVTTNNQWSISQAGPTSITWSGITSPITPIDLLDGSQLPNPNPQPPNTVRPIQKGEQAISFMSFSNPNKPLQPDAATIDDGSNVLDGFVFSVVDFDPGEVISLNWFLLDQNGDPVGTAGGGNQYGFGVVNLKRVDGGITLDDPIFEGNVGFDQSARSFLNDVHLGPGGAYTERI